MTCMPNAHIKGYLSQILCDSNNVHEEKWLVKLWNGKAFLLDFRVFRVIGSKPRYCIIKFSLQSSDTFNISPWLISIWAQPSLSVSLVRLPLYHYAPTKPQFTIVWISPSELTFNLLTLILLPKTFLFDKFILYIMTKFISFMNYFLIITAKSIILSPSTSVVHYYYHYYYYHYFYFYSHHFLTCVIFS